MLAGGVCVQDGAGINYILRLAEGLNFYSEVNNSADVRVDSDIITLAVKGPTPPGPTVVGCYNDYNETSSDVGTAQVPADAWTAFSWPLRDFPRAKVITDNSITACAAVAQSAGSAYFGMSKATECW